MEDDLRPMKRWLDNITEDCEKLNLTIHQASRLANDRVKKMEKYCPQQGHAAGARGHRLRRRGFKSKVSQRLLFIVAILTAVSGCC